MRTLIAVNNNSSQTMTIEELRNLRDSVKLRFNDPEYGLKPSSINKSGMTKLQAFKILFSDDLFIQFEKDEEISWIHFKNVVREFVLEQKTMTERWKKVKCVCELHDLRKEKLNKIEQRR